MNKTGLLARITLRRFASLFIASVIAVTGLLPLVSASASAAGQILNRSLTISSAVPSATNVTYTFTFTIPSTVQVQGLKFTACTNAIGTYPGSSCTPPAGMTAGGDGFSNAGFVSQTGWQGATDFSVDLTGANDCTASANVLCAQRTDTTSQTATARTIVFNTIKNPSAANTAFYVGINTYTTNTWTAGSLVDAGTTASAIVQTLSTNASVAEVLNFCVGSTTVDDTSTPIASDCTGISGTSLNLGTLDTSTVNISPFATNGGDSKNGVAMLRTNALNGSSISYDAIQQSGTNHRGTLRINGQTCNTTGDPGVDADGNTKTDPCINAAGPTQGVLTSGVERFGMTVAGVNSGSTTSYVCSYTAAPNNCSLEPATNYLGKGGTGTEDFGTDNGFAWVESGAATLIATSSSAVDDEALVLKFAATPSITTPFGSYVAQSDYIAVPTY